MVQRDCPPKVAAFFSLAEVPLDYTWKLAHGYTNNHIAESDLRWNAAANANHQAELDRQKSRDHPGGNGRCWIGTDLAFREASYDNAVLAKGSKSVLYVFGSFGGFGRSACL